MAPYVLLGKERTDEDDAAAAAADDDDEENNKDGDHDHDDHGIS